MFGGIALMKKSKIQSIAMFHYLKKKVQLGYPYSSNVKSSKHSHMRELRIQHQGEPYRVLYAFDPRRVAILLIGGCKSGDDNWYEKNVPSADSIYDDHLIEIKENKREIKDKNKTS